MSLKVLLEKYLAFIKRFIPESVVKPLVGIDLGSNACKLVELKASSSGLELVNWAIVPVLKGDYKPALQQVLSKLTVPANSIPAALYGKGTLVRYLDMPRMGTEEMKKSFAYEVDKYFPFPKDQIYTDCHILNAKEKDSRMMVLAAAAKKEMVHQRIDLLKEFGLEAEYLTFNSIGLANAYDSLTRTSRSGGAPGAIRSAVALLDIGERVSNLVILVQGEPRFTRDIFIGGYEMTSAVSNALSLDLKAAEDLKCNPGDRTEEVVRACESAILNLSSEVRLSFDYFATEKNTPIAELVLTGGGSLLEGLPEMISKNLEVPAHRWNLLEQLKVGPGVEAKELEKTVNRLGVAIGLALCAG